MEDFASGLVRDGIRLRLKASNKMLQDGLACCDIGGGATVLQLLRIVPIGRLGCVPGVIVATAVRIPPPHAN